MIKLAKIYSVFTLIVSLFVARYLIGLPHPLLIPVVINIIASIFFFSMLVADYTKDD